MQIRLRLLLLKRRHVNFQQRDRLLLMQLSRADCADVVARSSNYKYRLWRNIGDSAGN